MSQKYIVRDLRGFEDADLSTVGVGYKTTGPYDDGNVEVGLGDLCYWEDPDAGMHTGECPCICERAYVTRIECLYAVDYDWEDGYSIEVGVAAGLGRLSLQDVVLAQQDAPEHIERRFEAFQDSEYTKHMTWESHYPLTDVPEQMVEGHENARPSCWYDADAETPHIDGE
jgi:hypothetical protein